MQTLISGFARSITYSVQRAVSWANLCLIRSRLRLKIVPISNNLKADLYIYIFFIVETVGVCVNCQCTNKPRIIPAVHSNNNPIKTNRYLTFIVSKEK